MNNSFVSHINLSEDRENHNDIETNDDVKYTRRKERVKIKWQSEDNLKKGLSWFLLWFFLLEHYQRQIVMDLLLSNIPDNIINHRLFDLFGGLVPVTADDVT